MHVFCQLLYASIQQKMRAFAAAGAACHIRYISRPCPERIEQADDIPILPIMACRINVSGDLTLAERRRWLYFQSDNYSIAWAKYKFDLF